MGSFKDFVTLVAWEEADKVFNQRMPQIQKSLESVTGQAEVSNLNSDGTIDVKMNGQEFKNVSPGSNPVGVGHSVMLVGGRKVL